MSFVFVVDTEKRPLSPVHPGRARRLLTEGKAAVWRRYPFTILVKVSCPDGPPEPLRAKIDPGSKTTGLAVVNEETGQVVWGAELAHRGQQIKENLDQRRGCRRGRRQRHTRYRPARFANRRRPDGWLPPSTLSRVQNILTWVNRLSRSCPLSAISMELVKFDTHLLQNAEISGVEYQQGECAGYEVREYLLEKWGRTCSYCGKTEVPLEIEHIVPKSRGGSNRVSNLCLACHRCNQRKGTKTAEEFGYPTIQKQAKAPLKDTAAVNATRYALFEALKATGFPVETGTGGRTKYNRTTRHLPKTHWLDASCVGASTPALLQVSHVHPLGITAMGRHNRQMCLPDQYGFPRTKAKKTGVVGGFRTGDMVRALVPGSSKKAGVYVGRIAIRATGSCNLKTSSGTIQGIHYKYCKVLHRNDGYTYAEQ